MNLTRQQFKQLIREVISERKLDMSSTRPGYAGTRLDVSRDQYLYDFVLDSGYVHRGTFPRGRSDMPCSAKWEIEYKDSSIETFYIDADGQRVDKSSCVNCGLQGDIGHALSADGQSQRVLALLKTFGVKPNNVVRVKFTVEEISVDDCSTILNLPPDEPITQS